MHKELVISAIIIISVIIVNIISQNYTMKKMENIIIYIDEIKEDIRSQKNTEEIENKYDKMYKEWRNKYNIFAYYIEHDELEKVELELVTLKSYIETNYKEDAISNADRAKFLIRHIEEKNKFNLKNVF